MHSHLSARQLPPSICAVISEDAQAGGHEPSSWTLNGYWEAKCLVCGDEASVDQAGNCIWDNLQDPCVGEAA